MTPPSSGPDPLAQLTARVKTLEEALQLSAGSLRLAAGDSQIIITKTGIEIRSRDVSVTASGKVTVKASSDIVLKGAKILQN